ncbi:unnamed protein product [Hymenolepis diminuta]|uniref:Uncharacterized protein n=1 Tax=Hymenolepis diminuta TaxID=6216 RepID=A0A564Z7D2_HYMDI|nr:unnamed protein product [Hymenolepis diminuta]
MIQTGFSFSFIVISMHGCLNNLNIVDRYTQEKLKFIIPELYAAHLVFVSIDTFLLSGILIIHGRTLALSESQNDNEVESSQRRPSTAFELQIPPRYDDLFPSPNDLQSFSKFCIW